MSPIRHRGELIEVRRQRPRGETVRSVAVPHVHVVPEHTFASIAFYFWPPPAQPPLAHLVAILALETELP